LAPLSTDALACRRGGSRPRRWPPSRSRARRPVLPGATRGRSRRRRRCARGQHRERLTASTTLGSRSQIEALPRSWQPASIPWAITAATPVAAAASASPTEPIWTATSTPRLGASSTKGRIAPEQHDQRHALLDGVRDSWHRRCRSSAEASVSSSGAMTKSTPERAAASAAGPPRSGAELVVRHDPSPAPSTPQPPASDTAATSAGPPTRRSPRSRSGSRCRAHRRAGCAGCHLVRLTYAGSR
jgi:hypothetical protein